MQHPSLLPLAQCSDSIRKVGGKAQLLARLSKRGFALPATWVLDAEPFRDLVASKLPSGHDPPSIVKITRERAKMDRAAHARAFILEALLPDGLLAALGDIEKALSAEAPAGLIARGSPTVTHDGAAAMAGRGTSVGGARGVEELSVAVRRVWSSAYLPRTLAQFARRGTRDAAMAVIIQPFVVPDVSGLLSTRPPASAVSRTWRNGERLVNAERGFGGTGAVDVVRLSDRGEVVSALTSGHTPVLSADQCVALADLASRLETELAGPCFATFAFAGESLVLLQVATSGPADVPPGGELDSVWSRANVGESVPNVVSPLAWSLAEEFVEASIRRSLTGLGCSVPRGATLVANVSGRAYLNLSAVLAVAAQLPGVDPSAIVELAGTEGLEVIEKQARGVSGVSKRSFYARLPLTAARLLTEQTRLGFEVDGFCETVREARRTLGEIDLAILPDDALVPTLRDVRRLFDRTISVTSSATTAYALSHIALKTLLSRSLPVFAEHTTQVIVAGQALVSLRAARELASVAAVSLGDEPAHDALLGGSARAPLDLPEGLTRRALGRYLAEHGDLAISAAELAGPRWREDPSPVLAMLSSLARGAKRGLRTAPSARDRAERELDAVARRLPLLEQGLVRLLVERTRRFSELRERSHVAYMHVLAMLRGVALEVDRRLRRVDPTLPEGGAFFCTFEELLAALATGRPEVGHIVRLRLDEHALSQAMPDPPITFVGAPPPLVLPPTGHEVLRGVPASGGVGEGRARIIHSTDDLALVEHGEILVMKTADIARSPLFLLAGGIVTELGGPLTHGAVVARELSVPAVVHVVGAASGLRSGDRVRVDGDRGVVERVPGG